MKFDNIKILHLEDNEMDFDHISMILKNNFHSADITWVDTRAKFNKEIKNNDFDIILADYSLPGFNGTEALEIAKNTKPEIPFVFVSGAIGEDLAIESLKAGAKDYVVKDNYKRLVPAVKRAINEARERNKRKEAEKALRESENRLMMIFETSPVGVITVDNKGKFLEVNNAFCDMLGYDREELLKTNFLEILNGNHDKPTVNKAEILDKDRVAGEREFIKKDKTRLPVLATTWQMKDNKNGDKRIAAVIKDLTEHRELENQKKIHEAMQNQLERVTSLSHLSSAITHEIKQPLQSIKVIADSILYLNSKEKKLEYSEIIEDISNISERVDRINNIINSIKILINAPEKLEIKEINIVKQVNEVTKLYKEKVKIHDVELTFVNESEVNAVASEIQLQQVIINLIENAISALDKVTKKNKKIIIEIIEDAVFAVIKISDNGIGIDDKFKNKIFDAFFSLSNKVERMGMGLFIVSNIVKCFNGVISVEDNEMKGTTFIIKLKKVLEKVQ